MLILFDAVSSQSAATDAHRVVALGMISSASAVSSPPAMRKGRRRPKRDRDQSLRWQTMGWTLSPVNGPAIHTASSAATYEPSAWHIRDVFASRKPRTSWMPHNATPSYHTRKIFRPKPPQTT